MKNKTSMLAVSAIITACLPLAGGFGSISIPRTNEEREKRNRIKSIYGPATRQPHARLRGNERNVPCGCGSGMKAKRCTCAERIVKYDHVALSSVAEECTQAELTDKNFAVMEFSCRRTPDGIGLAANQIGWLKRVIFLFIDRMNGEFMLNPEITWKSEDENTAAERCLSYPGIEAQVSRPDFIKIKFRDRNWIERTRELSDWPARVFCHELDHLNGICRVGDEWRRLNAAVSPKQEQP